MYVAWCADGIVISNTILCYANFGGIPFKSLYVHAKTSLNSFKNCSNSNTLHVSNYALIFTICGSALVPKLSFINCWSLVSIHLVIYDSCAFIFARVSSIATLLGWWLYYDSEYTLSSRATFGSYLLPAIFFSRLYNSNSFSEIIVFTFVSKISTSMVFTYWIILSKLIVPIEKKFGCITKMISSSSFVMPS